MPLLSIPIKAREWLVKQATEILDAKAKKEDWRVDMLTWETYGFYAALRCSYPSEVVGLLIMDHDSVLRGEGTFTETLPTLVIRGA